MVRLLPALLILIVLASSCAAPESGDASGNREPVEPGPTTGTLEQSTSDTMGSATTGSAPESTTGDTPVPSTLGGGATTTGGATSG